MYQTHSKFSLKKNYTCFYRITVTIKKRKKKKKKRKEEEQEIGERSN